ncbi:MAG: glycosyltransferase family 4 protein [Candidatus Dormibacteraceae bacterium]
MTAARRRLALVHYTAPPVLGGVEAILGEQARRLRDLGHDVRIVTGRGDGEVVALADSRHPRVEALARALAAGETPEREFEALTGALLRDLSPLLRDRDCVIAHNVLTMPFDLPLARALSALPAPVVAWTHDLAWTNPRYRAYQRPGPLLEILHTAQAGVRYVAISEVRRREIEQTMGLPAEQVPVVPNGIDAEGFWGIRPETREVLARAGVEDRRPLLLVPVRVTRRKRLELAIAAVAALRRTHPDLQLVVTGPLGPHDRANAGYAAGLLEMRARRRLERAVHFLFEASPEGTPHPVTDQMIAELYRLADVVLLPSESEGFGLPVLEAALSRAPIVTADLPVLREVAGGGLFLFPPGGDGEAVAAAVERALATDASRLRRRALSRHDWPAVMQSLEAILPEPGSRKASA